MTNVKYMPQTKYSKNSMENHLGIVETISFTNAKMLLTSCENKKGRLTFQEQSYQGVQRMNILIWQVLRAFSSYSDWCILIPSSSPMTLGIVFDTFSIRSYTLEVQTFCGPPIISHCIEKCLVWSSCSINGCVNKGAVTWAWSLDCIWIYGDETVCWRYVITEYGRRKSK